MPFGCVATWHAGWARATTNSSSSSVRYLPLPTTCTLYASADIISYVHPSYDVIKLTAHGLKARARRRTQTNRRSLCVLVIVMHGPHRRHLLEITEACCVSPPCRVLRCSGMLRRRYLR